MLLPLILCQAFSDHIRIYWLNAELTLRLFGEPVFNYAGIRVSYLIDVIRRIAAQFVINAALAVPKINMLDKMDSVLYTTTIQRGQTAYTLLFFDRENNKRI